MKEWIKNLVLDFRKEYNKLLNLEKSKINNLDNLSPPLQIEVIIIKNQQLQIEHQLFIFTHFEDKEDLDIAIHEIDSCEAIEKLQEILKDEKWQRKLPEGECYLIKDEAKNKFATIIEGFFVNMLQDFKGHILNSVFSKPKEFSPRIMGKTYLTKDSFVWQALGDVRKKEAKEIAIKIIEEAKKSAQVQPQPAPPPSPRIKGFGTYFYPAIWIGKIPEPSFRERIFETSMPLFPKKAFDAEYKGFKVVVNENGFIAIGVEDKNQALKMLNEIMATALLLNYPFYAIRELELGEAEIDQEKLTICSTSISLISLRTALFEEQWMPKQRYSYIFREKKEIPKEELIKAIKQAEVLTKDEMVAEFLTYLLESYTYLQTSEYNQSFIISWITIEKYLSFRWKDFLKEKEIVSKRKEKLEDWTIGQFLEALNFAGKITDEQYKSFIEMKKKRDKFVHEGQQISKEDAEKCFKVCSSIIELLRSGILSNQ
ncbi:MAG: hypothetical protein J7K71_00565 [Candidatus Omnitrophica bacterium]|nr:hypothetical protein [Candidatus Omnitrophota bacterium]